MGRTFESVLYKGIADKSLRVTYLFELELGGKFPTISENNSGDIISYPAYMLRISSYSNNLRIVIGSSKYFTFVVLFEKSLKLIQENLFELFPNVGKLEFDMDDSVLERFQKEKALNSADITMMPAVYTDGTGVCSPGLRISIDNKGKAITIPLEDAIAIDRMFKTFDPNTYGLNILSQLIKIE